METKSHDKYICDKPCPICNSEVQLFGSDCYPVDGIIAECQNDDCQYELSVTCSIRTNNLLQTTKKAHDFMYSTIKGKPWLKKK